MEPKPCAKICRIKNLFCLETTTISDFISSKIWLQGNHFQIRLHRDGRQRRSVRHAAGKHPRSLAQVHRRLAQEARQRRSVRPTFCASTNGKATQLRPESRRNRRHAFHHERQAKHFGWMRLSELILMSKYFFDCWILAICAFYLHR